MAVALVLGAGGFIGRHVAGALADVPGLDVVGAGRSAHPEAAFPWVALDLLGESPALEAAIRFVRPDVVVNAAGSTSGSEVELTAANATATFALLRALGATEFRGPLVQLGSAAEYGPGREGVRTAEDAPARPIGAYGRSKLAATEAVVAWGAERPAGAVVLRVFNAIGPGMSEETLAGSAVARIRAAMVAGETRIEMGPLDAVRDFVDVRDVAEAVAAAATVRDLSARILNVASGLGHRARELVEGIAEGLGFQGEIAESAAGSVRSAQVAWQVGDPRLARTALGWSARRDLRRSVEFMLDERGGASAPAGRP